MSRLQLRDVYAKDLSGVTQEFAAGPHWVLCAEPATATQLIELCAGMARPKRGQVLLDDTAVSLLPYRDRGVLPATVTFPQLCVDRLMNLALHLKGATQTAQQVLSDWDLSDLGPQMAGTLDAIAARRVALLLALATPNPKLLALHDVFNLGMSREQLLARLSAFGERGTVVLLTADRSELDEVAVTHATLAGASVWVLQPSRFVRPDQLPKPQHDNTINTLFIMCSDARALSERLSRDPRVSSLRLDERSTPHLVEVTGTTADSLANAVADAALQGNVDIRHITPSLSPIFGMPQGRPQPPFGGGQSS